MKSGVLGLIAFALGGACGYAVGYYIGKKKTEEKADQEIAAMKEYYISKSNAKASALAKDLVNITSKKEEDAEGNDSEEGSKISVVEPSMSHQEKEFKRYSRIAHNYNAQNLENEEREDICTAISEKDYEEDEAFDKESLIYYEGDDMLATQYDEVVIVGETVGSKNLETLREFYEKGLGNVVYVRNADMETDYQVTLDTACFYKDILGTDKPGTSDESVSNDKRVL